MMMVMVVVYDDGDENDDSGGDDADDDDNLNIIRQCNDLSMSCDSTYMHGSWHALSMI